MYFLSSVKRRNVIHTIELVKRRGACSRSCTAHDLFRVEVEAKFVAIFKPRVNGVKLRRRNQHSSLSLIT